MTNNPAVQRGPRHHPLRLVSPVRTYPHDACVHERTHTHTHPTKFYLEDPDLVFAGGGHMWHGQQQVDHVLPLVVAQVIGTVAADVQGGRHVARVNGQGWIHAHLCPQTEQLQSHVLSLRYGKIKSKEGAGNNNNEKDETTESWIKKL